MEERITVTLRYVASGESQQSISFAYQLWKSTVSDIVSKTSKAVYDSLKDIYDSLKDTYLSPPKNSAEWNRISEQFEEQWNFPHVIGALDDKHVRIECPKLSGSLYHNYKGYISTAYY